MKASSTFRWLVSIKYSYHYWVNIMPPTPNSIPSLFVSVDYISTSIIQRYLSKINQDIQYMFSLYWSWTQMLLILINSVFLITNLSGFIKKIAKYLLTVWVINSYKSYVYIFSLLVRSIWKKTLLYLNVNSIMFTESKKKSMELWYKQT